jgi:hypothetical protein
MLLTPREKDAIDGLKFCLAHDRRPFKTDIKIVLRVVDRLMSERGAGALSALDLARLETY